MLTIGLDETTHEEVVGALAGMTLTTVASADEVPLDDEGTVIFVQADRRRRNGVPICRQLADTRPGAAVIALSERGSLDVAADAVRAGAYDFVVRPFERPLLERAIERALEHRKLQGEVRKLRDAANGAAPTNGGDAKALPSMEEVERRHLLHVLEVVGGNKATAARVLGVDRTTLYRKLERYAAASARRS